MAEPGSARARTNLAAGVADVVRKQADLGIDIVNDGEFSKVRGFSEYVRERLGGLAPGASQRWLSVMARDLRDFPGFVGAKFARHVDFSAVSGAECIAPLTYIGTDIAKTDIANLHAAVEGLGIDAYLTGNRAEHHRTLADQQILRQRRGVCLCDRRGHGA